MAENGENLKVRLLSEDALDFDAVLQRRIEELETGKVVGIPAEEAMKRLREKYAK